MAEVWYQSCQTLFPETLTPPWQAQGGSPDAASGSKAEVRFLIGVTSSCCTAKSAKLRAAVRGTWLAFVRTRHPDVDVKFIIAQPDSPNRRADSPPEPLKPVCQERWRVPKSIGPICQERLRVQGSTVALTGLPIGPGALRVQDCT